MNLNHRLKNLRIAFSFSVALFSGIQARAQGPGGDAHRTACNTARCRAIQSFVKLHYCGESPFGNGPDEGCDIKPRRKSGSSSLAVKADYKCYWDDKANDAHCDQTGEVPQELQTVLRAELDKLGVPENAGGRTKFIVWQGVGASWTVASAHYSRIIGADLELCDVILHMDSHSKMNVIRSVHFQKTDADVPQVTTWSLLDVRDVDGDGQPEIVLRGDAYEDHWIEVVSLKDGIQKTIFSGLGYYL